MADVNYYDVGDGRFHVGVENNDFTAVNDTWKPISHLASKAGIPKGKAIQVIPVNHSESNAGSANDRFITMNTNYISMNDPIIGMHEYGHSIDFRDNPKLRSHIRFVSKILPAYRQLYHERNETVADNNARKLLSTIADDADRAEALDLYNKASEYNRFRTHINRPRDIGRFAGSATLAGLGAIGGGYAGYKGADSLYRYFSKNKKGKPTVGNIAFNIAGAGLGSAAGFYGGRWVGDRLGSFIGGRFISNANEEKARQLREDLHNNEAARAERMRELIAIPWDE